MSVQTGTAILVLVTTIESVPRWKPTYSITKMNYVTVLAPTTGDQCMRDTTRADWRDRSDGLPGGVFLESSKNDTQFWYDGTNLRDDWAGNEELYGINSAQYVMLNVQ